MKKREYLIKKINNLDIDENINLLLEKIFKN